VPLDVLRQLVAPPGTIARDGVRGPTLHVAVVFERPD
jgi:hypothetical protein